MVVMKKFKISLINNLIINFYSKFSLNLMKIVDFMTEKLKCFVIKLFSIIFEVIFNFDITYLKNM